MKFYVMYAETCIEDYVSLEGRLQELEQGCRNSEFQYLDHEPIKVEISEDGGREFPDFILNGYIPLISEKMKSVLDEQQINNLFYKPITLTYEALGFQEDYFLALPPRIDCLDYDKSQIETEDNQFLSSKELIREATGIVINSTFVGNYKIFKLANVANQEIIVTEDLKNKLKRADLENVYFYELEGE